MNKRIITNISLEQYNKKYRNRTHKLVKYTKKEVEDFDKKYPCETKQRLLKDRKWALIKDTYYEIPKAPRVTWFRNLNSAIQVGTCVLAAGVVASAITVPTIMANKKNKTNDNITEITGTGKDLIKNVTFAKQSDGSYKGKIELADGKSKEDIKEIIIKTGNKVLIENTDYNIYDTGDVTIKAGVVNDGDNITVEVVKKDAVVQHIITFKVGTEVVGTVTVNDGEKINKPTDPTPGAGYKFVGWFNGDTQFKFDNEGKSVLPVTSSLTLTAKFGAIFDYLTFTRIGATNTCEVSASGEGTIPSDLVIPATDPITGYSIVKVADSGFESKSALTSVTLPTTITEIGDSAFKGCSQLATAALDNLTSLKKIGDYSFSGTAITAAVICESVNHIGYESFGGCSLNINNVTFKDKIFSWNLIKGGSGTSGPAASLNKFPDDLIIEELALTLTAQMDKDNFNYSWDNKYDFYDIDWWNNSIEGLGGKSAFQFAKTSSYIEIGKLADHDPETEFSSYEINGVNIAESHNGTKRGTINLYYGGDDGDKKLYVLSDHKIGFDDDDRLDDIGFFSNCDKVTEINLNNMNTESCKSLSNVFSYCEKLKKIDLSSWTTKYCKEYQDLFNGCSLLETVDISSFDTHNANIVRRVFYNCKSLKTIYASENFVTSQVAITKKSGVFDECSTNLVGGNGTVWSDEAAVDDTFAKIDKEGQAGYFTSKETTEDKYFTFTPIEETEHESGETVKVGYSIEAKNGETLSQSVVLPSTHKEADDENPLPVVKISNKAFEDRDEIKKIYVPSTIKEIGEQAFSHQNKAKMCIVDVAFNEGLKEIKPAAFYECKDLTSLVLPSSLETIGAAAFENNSSLTKVKLSKSLTLIDQEAFVGCDSLVDVDASDLDTPPSLTGSVFGDVSTRSNFKIYVKSNLVNTFKEAQGWSAYSENIVAKE